MSKMSFLSNMPKWVVAVSAVGATVGGIVLLKGDTTGTVYTNDVRIAGMTAIVTGANSGIGKETSKELAKRGAKVIMACRDMHKCAAAQTEIVDETYNKNVHCRELNLASMKSIRQFADKINKEEKHVEILVNNAAVMMCPKSFTDDGFEMQLGVNYLGHFLLTNLLLDKLKTSAPSRIINLCIIGSSAPRINFRDLNSANSYDPKKAYLQSKLAMMMFTRGLAEKLKGTKVSAYAVYPGMAKTEIGRHLDMHKSWISGTILSPIWWLSFKTPAQACQTVIFAAVEPSIQDETGKYWSSLKAIEYPDRAMKDDLVNRLWAVSEHWTRLDSDSDNK